MTRPSAHVRVAARLRTKHDVVGDLERRILNNEFIVGQKLPSERALGDAYAVSRPVIREALAGLVERGYIDVHPGIGSFVRALATGALSGSLTRAATRAGITARDLVPARLMLECTAADMAARNATQFEVDSIVQALDAHQRAKDVGERARSDLHFHEAVALGSGNPVITLMFGSIRTQVHALMLRSHSDRTVQRLGDPLHQNIADCIRARDPEGARAAMSEHVGLALTLYGEDLDRPLSKVLASLAIEDSPLLGPTPTSLR